MIKSSNTNNEHPKASDSVGPQGARHENRPAIRNQGELLLEQNGIAFEVEHGGAHLIVSGPDGLIDYWPGTGLWTTRKGKSGQGIYSLVRQIAAEKFLPGNSSKAG